MPVAPKNGVPYVEVPRHDEELAGVPAPAQVEAGSERRPDGTLAQGARMIPAKGGKAHKHTTRLSHRIETPATLLPEYVKRARGLQRALRIEIASVLGGGRCGIAASLFIKFAAQKTAAAEQAYKRGDFETHRKLTESARMDVLYAREHAAKEAQVRRQSSPIDDFETLNRAAEEATQRRRDAERNALEQKNKPVNSPGEGGTP